MRRLILVALATLCATPLRSQQPSAGARPAGQGEGPVRYAPRDNYPAGAQGSPNVKIRFHLPLTGATDIRVDQDPSRPYVYQAHGGPAGLHVINARDPDRAFIQYSWTIEEPDLHIGRPTGVMLFKQRGRFYSILSTQFGQQGPDNDVVGIVLDVTSLPDTSKVKEVARIRNAANRGGSHEAFTYKHSDGRALFFTTVSGAPFADIYDMDRVLAGGDTANGRVGRVPIPDEVVRPGGTNAGTYHDMYVAYDPATRQDKFYAAGWQNRPNSWNQIGYYVVFDVTRPEQPKLLATITGVPGVSYAHTFMATPDGRYAVGESERQYDPLYVFDLKPALDGTVKTISRPISAWTPNWKNLVHQFEIRWPYVFAAGYADGLHIFNMMDPANPYTVGYYDTFDGPIPVPPGPGGNWGDTEAIMQGNWGVDIRNVDGLIVVSDARTGTWGLHLDGFDGWNGRQWGMPNISSAQDWDNGPDGAPKPQRVSGR
ncbi:MAG: hypothetical protein HY700_21330 [Gemmatimonadetes bacterium]|nr:hypothetical protein [Gemmatimonadota bacterium]